MISNCHYTRASSLRSAPLRKNSCNQASRPAKISKAPLCGLICGQSRSATNRALFLRKGAFTVSVSATRNWTWAPEAAPSEDRIKIGICGFGNFGQFLAKQFREQGHEVVATSRTPYFEEAKALGVGYYTDVKDFADQQPDVIIIAAAIIAFDKVLTSFPVDRLKPNTVFVDVLSVKVLPKQKMLAMLPENMDILCAHPMFGPSIVKERGGTWDGLNFQYEYVRGADNPAAQKFVKIFEREGCRMVPMTCEEHDEQAARTQFLTHTVGRVLEQLDLKSVPINTIGYSALLRVTEVICANSGDLFKGLFQQNMFAAKVLEQMNEAFADVKQTLFDQQRNALKALEEPSLLGTLDEECSYPSPSYDVEAEMAGKVELLPSLKIGVVGFGPFGQYLSQKFVSKGNTVVATSRSDYSAAAADLGVEFYSDLESFCRQQPDVVVLATSIQSSEKMLEGLPLDLLREETVFVDVLSVKRLPKRTMLDSLPQSMSILCTHPVFGPNTAVDSWSGFNHMFEKVRVRAAGRAALETYLNIFASEGCNMVEMECEEHDDMMARTQFIAHSVGRMLERMHLSSTEINTKGFEALLSLVHTISRNSLDIYYGMYKYNPVRRSPAGPSLAAGVLPTKAADPRACACQTCRCQTQAAAIQGGRGGAQGKRAPPIRQASFGALRLEQNAERLRSRSSVSSGACLGQLLVLRHKGRACGLQSVRRRGRGMYARD